MTDVKTIATEVATYDEAILKFMPYLGSILGIIPGAQAGVPVVAGITALLKAIDDAAKAVSANTSADPNGIVGEIVNHLTPGAPNSPALS